MILFRGFRFLAPQLVATMSSTGAICGAGINVPLWTFDNPSDTDTVLGAVRSEILFDLCLLHNSLSPVELWIQVLSWEEARE